MSFWYIYLVRPQKRDTIYKWEALRQLNNRKTLKKEIKSIGDRKTVRTKLNSHRRTSRQTEDLQKEGREKKEKRGVKTKKIKKKDKLSKKIEQSNLELTLNSEGSKWL